MVTGKYHVHCGRCGFPIRVAQIGTVEEDPHRTYKCRNCGYRGPAWTFRSALRDISLVISDLVDKSEGAAVRDDFKDVLDKPHGSLSGVQRVLSKSLKRLDGRISKAKLKLLKAQVETKLDKDIMGTLFTIHLTLVQERARMKP